MLAAAAASQLAAGLDRISWGSPLARVLARWPVRQALRLVVPLSRPAAAAPPAGTEDGWIHRCSSSYGDQYLESYRGHMGPVYALQVRHPGLASLGQAALQLQPLPACLSVALDQCTRHALYAPPAPGPDLTTQRRR